MMMDVFRKQKVYTRQRHREHDRRATISVTSHASLKKAEKAPLLEIEPESSQNDKESDSYIEFQSYSNGER